MAHVGVCQTREAITEHNVNVKQCLWTCVLNRFFDADQNSLLEV